MATEAGSSLKFSLDDKISLAFEWARKNRWFLIEVDRNGKRCILDLRKVCHKGDLSVVGDFQILMEDQTQPQTQAQTLVRTRNRISIVDDEESILEILDELLSSFGFFVKTYLSPKEAMCDLDFWGNTEVLITDLKMEPQDGVSFVRQIRDLGFNGEVLVLSGFVELDHALTFLKSDVFEVILKPFQNENLIRSLIAAKDSFFQKIESQKKALRSELFEIFQEPWDRSGVEVVRASRELFFRLGFQSKFYVWWAGVDGRWTRVDESGETCFFSNAEKNGMTLNPPSDHSFCVWDQRGRFGIEFVHFKRFLYFFEIEELRSTLPLILDFWSKIFSNRNVKKNLLREFQKNQKLEKEFQISLEMLNLPSVQREDEFKTNLALAIQNETILRLDAQNVKAQERLNRALKNLGELSNQTRFLDLGFCDLKEVFTELKSHLWVFGSYALWRKFKKTAIKHYHLTEWEIEFQGDRFNLRSLGRRKKPLGLVEQSIVKNFNQFGIKLSFNETSVCAYGEITKTQNGVNLS